MIRPYVIDFETSIQDSIHGGTWKDRRNDIYTTIEGYKPDEIQVKHHSSGTNREISLPSDITHIVGHNLGFDLAYVFKNKCVKDYFLNGGKIWDEQVAEYILTGQQHRHSSLAELEYKYLGEKLKIDRISRLYKAGIGADKIIQAKRRCPRLFKLYDKYCYNDGINTLKVFKQQYIRAKKDGMLEVIELFNDYLIAIINMETSGIKIDMNKAEKLFRDWNLQYLEYLQKAQDALKSVWNHPDLPEFNVNSPDHKSAVLFGGNIKCGKKKVPIGKFKNGNTKYKSVDNIVPIEGLALPTKYTSPAKKQGLFKTGEDVISKLTKNVNNKVFLEYAEYTKKAANYRKMANTNVKGIIDNSLDGMLYPNFNNTTVITSRLSSSQPNMQNNAKHSKLGKDIHSLFIAPKGYKAVQVDFSQLEIWVSALLSGDEQLIKDLLSGIDMHCMRVSYMCNRSYEEVVDLCKVQSLPEWTSKRTAAKTFSYQRAYGAGVAALVESTGLPEETIITISQKEDERYPLAASMFNDIAESVEASSDWSKSIDLPRSLSKNTKNGKELLPIFDTKGNTIYNDKTFRKIGHWRSLIGKKYSFVDVGRIGKQGMRRSFPKPVQKNYPMQGTAADIQGATSAALTRACLAKPNKIIQINEVHDSKWFYIREDVLEPCIKYIVNVMEDVPKLFKERFGIKVPFKFPVDVEVGPNFADLKHYNVER